MKIPALLTAVAGAALLASSCVVGAPPGFSSGDSWSFPLVAPLEENELLVPVWINDKGPYLFLIDPDSEVSHVDNGIQSDLKLYTKRYPESLDERDKNVPDARAEVKKLRVGNKLTVSRLEVRVHKVGTYTSGGRLVRGVLGRDVIADSLIFAADRDKGIGYLATQGNYAPPATPEAVLTYRRHREQASLPRRRLVAASINRQHKVTMHVDLGDKTSKLWDKKAKALGLPRVGVRARTVDEMATTHIVDHGAMAAQLQVGDAEQAGVLLIPYADMRTNETDLDGSIGMNFFASYNLVANWHKKTLWLTRRNADVHADTKTRLDRWGSTFGACKNAGCVSLAIEGDKPAAPAAPAPVPAQPAAPQPGAEAPESKPDPSAEGPATDGTAPAAKPAPAAGAPMPVRPPDPVYTLRVTRDPNAPAVAYDVLVEAVDAGGKPTGLPRLLITLPAGQPEVVELNFDPNYAHAAALEVLDVSPFPRECRGTCVWPIMPKR